MRAGWACWPPTRRRKRAWTCPCSHPALQARLAALVHGTAGTSNPVDAGAGVAPAELGAMLDAILASGEADAVLVVPVATGVTDGSATMAELARVRAQHPDVPVVAVPLGGLPPAEKTRAPDHDLPDHGVRGAGAGPRGALRRVAGGRHGHAPPRSEPARRGPAADHGPGAAERPSRRTLAGSRRGR